MQDAPPTPPVSAAAGAPRGLAWSRLVLFGILSVFALIGLAGMIVFAFSAGALMNRSSPSQLIAGPATIDQVRSLKLLTVLSFEVTSDAESEHADRKGVWLARGKADYAVDFSRATVASTSHSSKVVRLRLPPPKVRNAHLDIARTRMLTYEKTGWGWWTLGALGSRQDFEQRSREMLQERIQKAAEESSLVDSAKGATVQLLQSLYETVGWTVQVEWSEEASEK